MALAMNIRELRKGMMTLMRDTLFRNSVEDISKQGHIFFRIRVKQNSPRRKLTSKRI